MRAAPRIRCAWHTERKAVEIHHHIGSQLGKRRGQTLVPHQQRQARQGPAILPCKSRSNDLSKLLPGKSKISQGSEGLGYDNLQHALNFSKEAGEPVERDIIPISGCDVGCARDRGSHGWKRRYDWKPYPDSASAGALLGRLSRSLGGLADLEFGISKGASEKRWHQIIASYLEVLLAQV
jgi:hypothetical protein